MITTRLMELRRRRGLMIALIAVNIGIPTVFLSIRLIAHAVDPKHYGPAGGYDIFTTLVLGFMYVFGFIVAAVVGCTAGSVDLTEGMFRHLVITGRSRVSLFFARVPAGLAVVMTMVAIGYTIVCVVCVFAAPTKLNFDGVTVPAGLSRPALDTWAANHADEVICNFDFNGPSIPPSVPCGNGQNIGPPPGAILKTPRGIVTVPTHSTQAQIRAFAVSVANQDYADYHRNFLFPSTTLMIEVGLWIALEATIGFIVGLGLASLMGQRTVPVILMIVLELILTPIFSRAVIAHLLNFQRSIVGVAMLHIEPGNLPTPFGGGGPGGGGGGLGRNLLRPESTLVSSLVIAAWLVVWTAIGAWRMSTRDA
ncbi:MAG TPA: hypothetical protein VKR22_01210 [Acidimicrobiales bacterium]|nr:hypothetical protein [Acidimicrobiales bacterium]